MGVGTLHRRKRYALAGCFLLVVAVLLGACQTNPPNETSASPNQGKQAESGKEAGKNTRTYASEKGDVEIPDNPSRVVVAVRDFAGDVMAAGVNPVGVPDSMIFDAPYYKEFLDGVESIGADNAVSLERIASLDPDLILTYQEDAYDNLSKIAPTILIPYGKYDYKDRLLEIGKLLNKEAEAKQRLDQFQQKVEAKKQQLAGKLNAGAKAAIIEITDKDLYLFGKTYGRGAEIVYNQLGLSIPAKVEEATAAEGWASISLETLPEYLGEADYILLGVRDTGAQRKTEIEASRLWTELPAVKAGKVYAYNLQEFYFQDVIALEHQLNVFTDFLLSK